MNREKKIYLIVSAIVVPIVFALACIGIYDIRQKAIEKNLMATLDNGLRSVNACESSGGIVNYIDYDVATGSPQTIRCNFEEK